MKNIIEIWGTFPPPIGGISIHLKRLFLGLRKFQDLEVYFYNFNSEVNEPKKQIYKVNSVLFKIISLLFKRQRIIHLHLLNPIFWYAVTFLGKRHILMLTLHGQNLRNRRNFIIKLAAKSALHKIEFIFLNDPDYRDFLIKNYRLEPKKLIILPAFIPPSNQERKGIPLEVKRFRARKKYIVSANAWKIYKRDGKDVYGIETLLQLVSVLKKDHMDVGLIFCYTQKDNSFYSEIEKKVRMLKIHDDVLFSKLDSGNAFEIWEISDLFIRPTSYDMEGISVKEALYLGTPTIASDVCVRPKEAIVYNVNDIEDLVKKTKKILMKKPRIKTFNYENVCLKLHDFYTRKNKVKE